MDRPEWIDTFPGALTAIASLTNNSSRGSGTNPARRRQPAGGRVNVPTAPSSARDAPPVVLRARLQRARPSPGTSSPSPATRRCRAAQRLDDQRRQVRLARRPLRRARAAGCGSRPTSRASTHQHGRPAYAGFGNNQMLCADPSHEGDPAVPGRAEAVRDHRRASPRPTRRRISSASSTPASARTTAPLPRIRRRSGARGPTALPPVAPGPPSSPSRRTTAASSAPERGARDSRVV